MKWQILDHGVPINTIVGSEDFCVAFCQQFGYTYEQVVDPDPSAGKWIADRDYDPGEYLTIDTTMYKVLLPIFAGAQITPGTNAEETTIEAELAREES